MNDAENIEQVGVQDPELRNSPVADESSDLEYDIHENVSGLTCCFFNEKSYPNGAFVCSGTDMLRCDRGVWEPAETSESDSPS